MHRRALLLCLSLALSGCSPSEDSHTTAILGAVLLDGLGGPPLSDSVVVVAGDRIRAAGARSTVAIPEEANKVDGSGKFLVPALIDIYPKAAPDGNFTVGHPATPDEARTEVARLAAQKVHTIYIWKTDPAVAQAALEAARDAGIQAIGRISEQDGVRSLVKDGVAGFIGMMTDTENLDPGLLAQLRDLRIFFAPSLSTMGDSAGIASRNTQRLFAAGVPIALASNGADPIAEAELLAASGIPALDVVVAATRNSAAASGRLNETGTVQAGKLADLLLLSANPGEDIRNLRKVALRISAGSIAK